MLRLIISIFTIALFQTAIANEKALKFATDFFKSRQSYGIQKHLRQQIVCNWLMNRPTLSQTN